jgi:CRP-like cAMP-binding protein
MELAVNLIEAVPLFERLEESLREQIDTISEVVTADADAVLSRQNAMPEFLHVLLEGQVALTSTAADGTTALVEV